MPYLLKGELITIKRNYGALRAVLFLSFFSTPQLRTFPQERRGDFIHSSVIASPRQGAWQSRFLKGNHGILRLRLSAKPLNEGNGRHHEP
ncbi:hypothetical protein H5T87_03730 [bacterium]|nr:hypothetical protein [bacterium]